MKVLHISQYISIADDPEFSRNISGYGYMILDIAKSESEFDPASRIELITHNCITNGKKIGNLNLLPRRWYDIVRYIKFEHIVQSIRVILKNRYSLFWIIRIVFYYLGMGHIQSVIEKGNYDIIHVHGIAYSMVPVIEFCKLRKINLIVTLHGLISFDEGIGITKNEVLLERNFLKQVMHDKLNLTVVSSGIKREILSYLGIKKADNIFVILNGISLMKIKKFDNHINIREYYSIPASTKIVLCVGNISINKNQLSVLRALKTLNVSLSEKFRILFLGYDNTGVFEQTIHQLGLAGQVIFCGNISRDTIGMYYYQADYTILASKSEGFGLSIIEGFSYGLPCITFADLDVVTDIYNPQVMYLIEDRTEEALANGMIGCIEREWDKNFIKQYASQFSLEVVANNYLLLYNKVI